MIGIEDLKESLRQQLCALIVLYEDDPTAADCLRHGGNGTRELGAWTSGEKPATAASDASDPTAEARRADEIELCLVCLDAAIKAAERAERTRDDAQRIAFAAMARGAAARRVTTALRQDLQRLLLAAGRSLGAPDGERDARRVGELRAALRMSEATCRNAEREAQEARRRAEIAISSASAALLAAIQADPSRGNPGLDPVVARAARALAERAADDAARSLDEGSGHAEPVVVPFERGMGSPSASGRSGDRADVDFAMPQRAPTDDSRSRK